MALSTPTKECATKVFLRFLILAAKTKGLMAQHEEDFDANLAGEEGPTEEVIQRPKHPYTQLLLSAVPDPRAPLRVAETDVGEPPKVVDPKEGCRFRARCPYAIERCESETPLLRPIGIHRLAACHVAEADQVDLPVAALEPR